MKELLSQEGLPFTAHNVDEDDRAYDELIARGWRTVPVTVFGARETTHTKINADLGLPDDPATKALFEFLDKALKK